jgi:hypothetical protein
MRALTVATLAALTVLAACGTQEPDRATGGAATGAGTGAVIGLIGGPIGIGVGALIGGAVGATTGAAVSPKNLTLPPAPWSGQHAASAQQPD